MKLTGARSISRVARNFECQLQAAMAFEQVDEVAFHRRVLGYDYAGEVGERESARRRGIKFEQNLYTNGAAKLREALAPLRDLPPTALTVRNFDDEFTSSRDPQLMAARVSRTRRILRDLAQGRDVPDILIHPMLTVSIDTGQVVVRIEPDALLLDRSIRIYEPVELKSFIVRDGVADKGDREPMRRQAAVQIVALRQEAMRFSIDARVRERAIFVFATPWGLDPAPAEIENLYGEVRDTLRALDSLRAVKLQLDHLRAPISAPLQELADDLPIHLKEGCVGTCLMIEYCRQRVEQSPVLLGDAMADLASGLDLDRLIALLHGSEPANAIEEAVARQLSDDVRVLGYARRVA